MEASPISKACYPQRFDHIGTEQEEAQKQMNEQCKHYNAQMMQIRTCPVHGEGMQYKETLAMMQAQSHAYAFSCFLYF